MQLLLILVSLAFGAYRIFLEPTVVQVADTYKDLAHIFVGMLLGGYIALKNSPEHRNIAPTMWYCFLGLTTLEILMVLAPYAWTLFVVWTIQDVGFNG